MSTLIARNDALVVQQVTTLTPTAANSVLYDLLINTKLITGYTSDSGATVQEIVEGLQPLLDASEIPEFAEVTWAENNSVITGTGPTTGKPFTVTEGPGAGNFASITTGTTAKGPNHWIAENFSGGSLPVNSDTVIITQLTESQSFKWSIDQNAVALTLLDIRADSLAQIGLPEINTDSTSYYEYRETHLKIQSATVKIGDGDGQGSKRIKLNLGTATATEVTVFKTSTTSADQDEACVHLVGANAGNSLQVFAGTVDIAMLPGYTATWPTIIASGGRVRCGTGVTLTTVEAAGNSKIETRSAVATIRTRESGSVIHIGAGSITTLDIAGGPVTVKATGILTIGTLNGYGGKSLDLSHCDSLVTITNMNIYATPSNQFTIKDPNNKLVMSNAASTPNGAQSLVVITGSGRNVRIT